MHDPDHDLLSRCGKNELVAQKQLFDRFAPKMFGICLRYSSNGDEACDILQDGFLTVFHNIDSFRYEGSVEGWIKRIIVNTAINHCKHTIKLKMHVPLADVKEEELQAEDLSDNSTTYLLEMIQQLPPGYRTIFNMHILEAYSHHEIAEMLGISVGTSKSQLTRAKSLLRRMLKKRQELPVID